MRANESWVLLLFNLPKKALAGASNKDTKWNYETENNKDAWHSICIPISYQAFLSQPLCRLMHFGQTFSETTHITL